MQVYLLKDLPGRGKAGEIIDINEGYARNFVLRNGIGKVADNTIKAQVQSKQQSETFHRNEDIAGIKELCARIAAVKVELCVKLGSGGKMFGSITGQEIAAELKNKGFDVEKKNLVFEPVKELGTYKIKVKFNYGLEAIFTLEVKNGNANPDKKHSN